MTRDGSPQRGQREARAVPRRHGVSPTAREAVTLAARRTAEVIWAEHLARQRAKAGGARRAAAEERRRADVRARRSARGKVAAASRAYYRRLAALDRCPLREPCPRTTCPRCPGHLCEVGGPLAAGWRIARAVRYALARAGLPQVIWARPLTPEVAARRLRGRLCRTHREQAEPHLARELADLGDAPGEGWASDLLDGLAPP